MRNKILSSTRQKITFLDNLDISLKGKRNPRPMRLSSESGTVEAIPKLQNTNQIDQIAQLSHLKAGLTFGLHPTDIATIREVIKKADRWPFSRLSQFPIKFPTFQLLPKILLLTNQLYEKRKTVSESIALISEHPIGAVDDFFLTIKYIAKTGKFREISDISVGARKKGAAWNKKS